MPLFYVLLPRSAMTIDSHTLINQFYSFITLSLIINNLTLFLELFCFDTLSLHTFSLP